jgi:hypothetical protein
LRYHSQTGYLDKLLKELRWYNAPTTEREDYSQVLHAEIEKGISTVKDLVSDGKPVKQYFDIVDDDSREFFKEKMNKKFRVDWENPIRHEPIPVTYALSEGHVIDRTETEYKIAGGELRLLHIENKAVAPGYEDSEMFVIETKK